MNDIIKQKYFTNPFFQGVHQRFLQHYHLLSAVIEYGVKGEIVECGTHRGLHAGMIIAVRNMVNDTRPIHLYDSWLGLPNPTKEDQEKGSRFHKGTFRVDANEFKTLSEDLKALGKNIYIHRGWFKDTLPTQLPQQIAYAHLDGDLYESIKCSLEHIYPRLTHGAAVVIDDYELPGLPGVRLAVDQFMKDKETVHFMNNPLMPNAFQAWFRKQHK